MNSSCATSVHSCTTGTSSPNSLRSSIADYDNNQRSIPPPPDYDLHCYYLMLPNLIIPTMKHAK